MGGPRAGGYEGAQQELDDGALRRALVHRLGERIPVTVNGPEHDGLEHDACRDGRVRDRAQSAAPDAVLQVALEQAEQALSPRRVPGRGELRVVVRAAVDELDAGAMTREHG